jgi:hypothetical protein
LYVLQFVWLILVPSKAESDDTAVQVVTFISLAIFLGILVVIMHKLGVVGLVRRAVCRRKGDNGAKPMDAFSRLEAAEKRLLAQRVLMSDVGAHTSDGDGVGEVTALLTGEHTHHAMANTMRTLAGKLVGVDGMTTSPAELHDMLEARNIDLMAYFGDMVGGAHEQNFPSHSGDPEQDDVKVHLDCTVGAEEKDVEIDPVAPAPVSEEEDGKEEKEPSHTQTPDADAEADADADAHAAALQQQKLVLSEGEEAGDLGEGAASEATSLLPNLLGEPRE